VENGAAGLVFRQQTNEGTNAGEDGFGDGTASWGRGRIEDVILFDPADEGYSIGFNVLSAHSNLEKNLLASDLISVFQRLSTSWGDQMASVLQNAILAFLESSRGGTLFPSRSKPGLKAGLR
jgi:hypothetical protein